MIEVKISCSKCKKEWLKSSNDRPKNYSAYDEDLCQHAYEEYIRFLILELNEGGAGQNWKDNSEQSGVKVYPLNP